MKAVVTLQEFPGQKFKGTVARTAEAIDPATRTLLTEVDVPNQDGRLLPGSFGQVHFRAGNNAAGKVTVPVNAMLFRQEGPRVAVVGCRQQSAVAAHHHRSRLRYDAGDSRRPGAQGANRRQSRRFAGRRPAGQCRARRTVRTAPRKQGGIDDAPNVPGGTDCSPPHCSLDARWDRGTSRPPAQAPNAWKTEARGKSPRRATRLPKGAWWEIFGDAQLNAYEQQLLKANQSLVAAKDRLDRRVRWRG